MITAVEVRQFMGLTSPDAALTAVVEQAVAATNTVIAERCPALLSPWPADVVYAAQMQASRLVKRRASPEGVAGMGDFGPVRISVMDPDIEQLLSPYLGLAFALTPLAACTTELEEWLRAAEKNVGPDVVPPAGDVGFFDCRYHQNIAKGISGVTQADVTVRVYVSRAEEADAKRLAATAQTDLYESLESWPGPWRNLTVQSSTVAEETLGEATYVAVRLSVRLLV